MTNKALAGILTLGVFISCDKSDDSEMQIMQYVSSVSAEGLVERTIDYKYGGLNNITEIDYNDSDKHEAVIKFSRHSIDYYAKRYMGGGRYEEDDYKIALESNDMGYADCYRYYTDLKHDTEQLKSYEYNKDNQLIYSENFSFVNGETDRIISSETSYLWQNGNLISFTSQHYDEGKPSFEDEVEITYSDIKYNTNFNLLDLVLEQELSVYGADLLGVYSKCLPKSISYKGEPDKSINIEYKLNDKRNPEKITVASFYGKEVYTIKYID